jgi:hypothetical protein
MRDEPTNDDHRWDLCPHCRTRREAHFDRKTGRAVVTLPSRCPDRGRCEQEVLPGFSDAEENK